MVELPVSEPNDDGRFFPPGRLTATAYLRATGGFDVSPSTRVAWVYYVPMRP